MVPARLAVLSVLVGITLIPAPAVRAAAGLFDVSGDEKKLLGKAAPGALPAANPPAAQPIANTAVAQATPAAPAAANSDKPAIPDEQSRHRSIRFFKSVYSSAYEDTSSAGKRALAKKLTDRANRPTLANPADRYVALVEANTIYADLGDITSSFASIDKLAEYYAVDAQAMKFDAMVKAAGKGTPQDCVTIANTGMDMLDGFMKVDAFDQASRCISAIQTAATRSGDANLINQVAEVVKKIGAVTAEHDKIKPFFDKLQSSPKDPAANLAVGLFYSLSKGDWVTGMPYLAKGSDKAVAELAQTELKNPATADDQDRLAQAWWEYADKQSVQATAQKIRDHAATWYRKALPGLRGFRQSRAMKRGGEAEAAPAATPAATVPALPTSKPAAETKATDAKPSLAAAYQAIADAVKAGTIEKTAAVGDEHHDGRSFLEVPRQGAILTGLVITCGKPNDDPRKPGTPAPQPNDKKKQVEEQIIKSIRPIFQTEKGRIETGGNRGHVSGKEVILEAKTGFAIGKITMVGTERVQAIRVTYMKIKDDGSLDPKGDGDTKPYESKPYPLNIRIDQDSIPIGGDGTAFIGIHGSVRDELASLGAVTVKK